MSTVHSLSGLFFWVAGVARHYIEAFAAEVSSWDDSARAFTSSIIHIQIAFLSSLDHEPLHSSLDEFGANFTPALSPSLPLRHCRYAASASLCRPYSHA